MAHSLLRRSVHFKAVPKYFQLVSDLHLEIGQQYAFCIAPKAPYLILAGEIGRLVDPGLSTFLRAQCAAFDKVFYILGNHEFYGASRSAGLASAETLRASPGLAGKLELMHRARFDIPDSDITVLGCTLQSHVPAHAQNRIARTVHDFLHVGDWTVSDHNAEHALDVAFLEREIKAVSASNGPGRRVVVVTHHASLLSGTSDPRHHNSPINCAFATDILPDMAKKGEINGNVKIWAFGHTHWNVDFDYGGVRVLANQRGYVKDGLKLEQKRRQLSAWARMWGGEPRVPRAFDAGLVFEV